MSFVEVKQKKKYWKNKIKFFTTDPTKYGLKFSVLSIIINERKLLRNIFRWS